MKTQNLVGCLSKDIEILHNHGKAMPTFKINGELTDKYRGWAKDNLHLRQQFIAAHGEQTLIQFNMYSTLKSRLKYCGTNKSGVGSNFRLKNSRGYQKFGS